jgi:hypothetical protein
MLICMAFVFLTFIHSPFSIQNIGKPRTSAINLQHYEKAGQHHPQKQVRKVTTLRFLEYIAWQV